MGKTRTRTETNQTSNVNSTTTPQTPGFISEPWQQFMGNASNLAGRVAENPYQFAAPANDLQNRASTNAQNLGGWQPLNNTASNLALAGATGGANLAGTPQTYQASQIPGVNLGPAPQGQATSFSAPQIGAMSGYTAPQVDINSILSGLGPAPTVSAGSASAGTVGPAAQATASDASGLIGNFRNAGLNDYVSSVQADAQAQADRVRQAQAAQAAGAGAFGGSRYGIREAQTEGELARAESAATSGARFQAENAAIQAALQQAGLNTGVSTFNAGESNTNQRTQAGLDTQASVANAGNATQASIAQGGFARDYGLAGLDAQTRAALTNAGLSADSLRFLSEANNNRTMQQGQFDYGAASQNADASNRFGLANLDLAGQYGLRGAELGLQRDITQAGLNTDAARFGADAFNTTDRFNAGQQDNALARLLSGAGLMYQGADSYGANSRGDASTQSQIGNDQWNRDNYLAGLPISLQQQVGGMLGQVPLGAFVGSNTQGTEQTNGTSTSVQSQGIGSMLGGLLGAGLSGWAGGGFGLPFKI